MRRYSELESFDLSNEGRRWPGGANLVGTLVDHQVVRVPGVGDYEDDAVLVFLQAIRNASQSSWIFERMWKTIRGDRTVDMWWYDHENPSRSVSLEFQFHKLFAIDDLYLCVSTFVPFGAPGDRSFYKAERSDDYQRSTQSLRAILSVQGRRVTRASHQGMSSNEKSWTSSNSQETSRRLSSNGSSSQSTRWTQNDSTSSEDNERYSLLLPGHRPSTPGEFHRNVRNASSSDNAREWRLESSCSDTSERGHSAREQDESSYRNSTSDSTEEVSEIVADVKFSAIGPDFSQPDQTYASWKAHPDNKDSALTIEMINIAVPTLGPIIERGVAHRRMERRSRRDAEPNFWDEAKRLIAYYNPAAYGQRTVMEHDGTLNPIEPSAMVAAFEEVRYTLGEMINRSQLLPPGQ